MSDWQAERDAMLRVRIMQGDVIANHVIAMQAAIIEAAQVSPKEGLRWIFNTLRGPGFLPDMEEATRLGSAQAWFDAKTAEHEAFRAANPGPAEPKMVAVCCGRRECGGECGNEWQGEVPVAAHSPAHACFDMGCNGCDDCIRGDE